MVLAFRGIRGNVLGLFERTVDRILWVLAFCWRSLLVRTTFIAVTGSVGKTAAKDCLAAILERHGPTLKTVRSNNGGHWISRAILGARPWHRYVVLEVGIDQPGHMIRHALMIRPDIAIELAVASPHLSTMGSLEAIATEKAKLLRFLGRRGAAVLNGDDPRVAAMASQVRCRVVRFGTRSEFDVWANQIASSWPARLEFQANSGNESCWVRTEFVGTQWVPSMLAALAAAKLCGVALSEAAQALRDVRPYTARMEPVELPGNITFLRDEAHGNLDDTEAAFEVLRNASASRRVLVISDVANSGKHYRQRQRMLAQRAAESADMAVFVSDGSDYAARQAVRAGMAPGSVHHFFSVRQAAEFLRMELRSGDLVLLKGQTKDHLSRIYLAQLGTIECWKTNCGRRHICDGCDQLGLVRFESKVTVQGPVRETPQLATRPGA
jgi:UDP-N-acetylmuramoyl-tripeptide--D-alanyl-D-alanine ligase